MRERKLSNDLERLQASRYKLVTVNEIGNVNVSISYRCILLSCRAPLRPLQCEIEEQGLSVCNASTGSIECRQAVNSYASCADKLVHNVILPFRPELK